MQFVRILLVCQNSIYIFATLKANNVATLSENFALLLTKVCSINAHF